MTLQEAEAAGLHVALWPKTEGCAKWTTPYGTELTIESVWDWVVFGDVWINREYAFDLKPSGKQLVIYDFGANVGYFSLYAADRCKAFNRDYVIHAYEADPYTVKTLSDRVQQDKNIIVYNQAIGKNTPFPTRIAHSENHATSTIALPEDSFPVTVPVYWADLADAMPPDMIKCDIEGSEYDLIDAWPNFVRSAPIVFMEIHYPDDAHEIYDFMAASGFTHQKIRQHGMTVMEVFYK